MQTFKNYCAALDRVARKQYGWRGSVTRDSGAESWRMYYDAEYSPDEALAEDFTE